MSKSLRKIGVGFLLPATAFFTASNADTHSNSGAEPPAAPDKAVPPPPPITGLSENKTASPPAAADFSEVVQGFRADFANKVRLRNNSSKWSACYSTVSGNKTHEYDGRTVRNLRADFKRVGLGYTPVNKDIVVLDLGHGHEVAGARAGYDTGTIDGATGLRETTVIDRIAVPLKEKLEQDYNLHVVFTRAPLSDGITLTNSTSKFTNQRVALQVRAELAMTLAEKFPGHRVIFASIHGNSGKNSGAEIYYYAPVRGGQTDMPESKELARSIAANYQLHPRQATKIMGEDFAVLRCQTNPAVLIELGYLQNASDRAALKETDRISSQIANGIGNYLEQSRPKKEFSPYQVAVNAP